MGAWRTRAEVRRLALVAALALAVASAVSASPRLLAIGDVHGAIDELDAVLRAAGLIDAQGVWAGGDAVLVQTGDFTDRGSRVRAVMDRLRSLQEQADAAGGEVHVLLGNHEAMNMLRLFRDVNPDTLAEFASPDSEDRRRAALERWLDYTDRMGRKDVAGLEVAPEVAAEEWLAAHPPGWLEYAESFGPDGEYGRWLRRLPASVRVDDTIFVHGGFSDELELDAPDELNEALAADIERFDDARRHLVREGVILPSFDLEEIDRAVVAEVGRFVTALREGRSRRPRWARERHRQALLTMAENAQSWALRSDGPLWFRGYGRWSEEEGGRRIGVLAERFDARRFVVGHTVVAPPGRIRERFSGRVFLIDTGMLPFYGGRPSALEIAGGEVKAVYPGHEDEVIWRDP